MDYVVGSVAALITGNVTPNRPRLLKRALTPTKHQPSPNVTPKSEFVEDRSIFLSPTMQKKKAIVKKSPKRIFQNPDLETTDSNDGNLSITSPKAEKVKKHLKDELDNESAADTSITTPKSPKKKNKKSKESIASNEDDVNVSVQNENEVTPKKKKRKHVSESENTPSATSDNVQTETCGTPGKSPKKMKQRRKSIADSDNIQENNATEMEIEPETTQDQTEIKINNSPNKKKNKKRKKKSKTNQTTENNESNEPTQIDNTEDVSETQSKSTKKKNKKKNKKAKQQNEPIVNKKNKTKAIVNEDEAKISDDETTDTNHINPNAITEKDSDSEHDSDDEILSENEEINKAALEADPQESSDEEEEAPAKEKKNSKPEKKEKEVTEGNTEEELRRTLFVGNVPFSKKCKKEVKKIFNKHGRIETVRIRTVPVKDGRYTPKMALIKNELHPERTTVNVYIKFADPESVEKALVENNTVLNDHHLRVSRSNETGVEHDPKCSVFIGNLPFNIEDETLRAKFEQCGDIESVRIIRDKKTNAGKGFGYVNFKSKDGVELALQLSEEDLTIKNRILRVKRCTQTAQKGKPGSSQGKPSYNPGKPGSNHGRPSFSPGKPGFNRGKPGFSPGKPGFNRGRPGDNQGRQNQGGFRGKPGGFRGGPGQDNDVQGFRKFGGNRGQDNDGYKNFGGQRGQNNDRFNKFGGNRGQNNEGFNKFGGNRGHGREGNETQGQDGAHRRILHKRKFQEGGDGPPNKRQKDIQQPTKEKKTRKEFVGLTAEKKKKNKKVDKGQKQKKALSEILTK